MWQKSTISDVLTQIGALYKMPSFPANVPIHPILSFSPILRGIFKAEIAIHNTCVSIVYSLAVFLKKQQMAVCDLNIVLIRFTN